MPDKIDETLKKLAAGIRSGKTPASPESADPPKPASSGLPGDPNCPLCGGVGYLRRDLPVGHPEFGKLEICSCRAQDVSQQVRSRLFALSQLDELQHLTFDNFQPRGAFGLWPNQADTVEWAFNKAQKFAQTLNGWMLLQGGYGCGKTHLAAAIANFAVSMGVPTLFITVPDLLDSLRFAYHDPNATFEERFDEIRNAPLLILDDFGTQNATPWAQEKLFQIVNYRYTNQLPTVVTTNLQIEEIEARIRSRLQDPKLVDFVRISASDYRLQSRDIGHHELSSLHLLNERTFESFELRRNEGLKPEEIKSLEAARQAAFEYAQDPRGWIVFTGPYGSGKTHLAAAIANYRTQKDRPPLFIVVPDLMDHLRATFSPNSTVTLDRRFEEVRTCPLLILDDLGSQSATPWAREKLYQLFNHRYNAGLATVITTSSFKGEMDPRLLSRMEDRRICRIYAIQAPSYRGLPTPETRRTRRARPSDKPS